MVSFLRNRFQFQSALRTENEESPMSNQVLERKQGYVVKKIRDTITVNVDDETVVAFSLEKVEATFAPQKFDQIVLYCENPQDIIVRRIEVPYEKKVTGLVTSIEPGRSGTVDTKYLFYWEALDDCAADIARNDRVEASCVECKITDENPIAWRCLKVTRINQPTANVRRTVQDKHTMNKNGIEITEDMTVEFNDIHEKKNIEMTVKNTSNDDVKVLESRFVGNPNDSQLVLESPTRKSNFLLKSGDVKVYKFEATSKMFGTCCEKFTITFQGATTGKFYITRYIKVNVHDTEHRHRTIGTGSNVRTNVEYTRSVMARHNPFLISGPSPGRQPNFVAKKIGIWDIPETLRDIALNPTSRNAIFDALANVCPHLNDPLDDKNYSKVFHDLLHLEECAMEHSIRIYDVKSSFTREGDFLALRVENVAESRPSIVIGDFIVYSDPWANVDEKKLDKRLWIHEVKQNHILLKPDEGFPKEYKGQDYQITFHFSRKSLRKQHHAIELAQTTLLRTLFPTKIQEINKQVDVELDKQTGDLRSGNSIVSWFNPQLNIVQKQAVTNILHGVARPMPYVIFGPPGTGKTVTVIETILQIAKNLPNSRILVATPSNSAANLITERIVASGVLKQNEFIRLLSHNNVNRGFIPPTIRSHCGTIDINVNDTPDETELQMKCNAKRLKLYRILIGTCITLGTLLQLDLDDHFSHVIIDESGQSLETETIIPMSFVDKDIGQIILAGDPHQLGPIVLSPFAKRLGLARSFLARMLETGLYKPDVTRFEHDYDPRLVTRLVYNYRSVPSIMNVYSDLFYDGSLKSMINDVDSKDAKVLNNLTRILPNNKANGVVFIAVCGKNERGSESPSWCNKEEADNVKKFFDKLIGLGQQPKDIGIITPYTAQVKAIRKQLKRNDESEVDSDVKIGTVEEFQGQERKIILLSTVRTVERHLSSDLRYSLGFIRHPNRMNVAISRARSLLVIFGSPTLLSLDDNWQTLIEHCKRNESYVGCDE